MNELGAAILIAMFSQGWTVARLGDDIVMMSPDERLVRAFVVPAALFEQPNWAPLEMVLLDLIGLGGLRWDDSPEGGDPAMN